MEGKISCFERRIEMLFVLIQRRKTTVPEMAEMFSVSKNTAYADISFLSHYAPIYTKSGNHGGVYLLDGYHNEMFVYLSNEEEMVLKNLLLNLEGRKRIVVGNILNKFSMPKPEV